MAMSATKSVRRWPWRRKAQARRRGWVVQKPGEQAGGAEFVEDGRAKEVEVAICCDGGIEAGVQQSLGSELAAEEGIGNALGGDGVDEASGVATSRMRPRARGSRRERGE